MKYCFNTTAHHSVSRLCPNVTENIETIVYREGFIGGSFFPNKEVVINMDTVEAYNASLIPRDKVKSMDIAFGISNPDGTAQQMVLVDLKLNVQQSLSSISKDDLTEKIIGSRTALGAELAIHGRYIFIFQSNLVEQARRLFFRWHPRLDGENTAMDIPKFRLAYF